MKIEIRDIFNEGMYNIEIFNKEFDNIIYDKLKQSGSECGYYMMIDESDNIIFKQEWNEIRVINGRENFLNLLNYINSIIF
jgi:hypothetical protein